MPDVTPTPTSVYKYYDADDILIYVGITGRGISRNSEHNKTKSWWSLVAKQTVEHCATRLQAERRETELIRKMAPPFNKQQNADYEHAQAAYMLRRSVGGDEGIKAVVDGRKRVPAVVANTVGNRVTLVVASNEISFDDLESIRVDSDGRKAKLLDSGTFADGSGVWVRVETPDAERCLGAVVMYKHGPGRNDLSAKFIEITYQKLPKKPKQMRSCRAPSASGEYPKELAKSKRKRRATTPHQLRLDLEGGA